MPSIYKIAKYCYSQWSEDDFEPNTWEHCVYYTQNLAKAGTYIKGNRQDKPKCLGYKITEFPLDTEFDGRLSIRTYLADGTQWDESLTSTICKEIFHGRPSEKCKFHEGDIAIYREGNRSYFAIVAVEPPTPVFATKFNEALTNCVLANFSEQDKAAKPPSLDAADDSYIVITYKIDESGKATYCHSHPECTDLFPLPKTAPTKVVKLLKQGLARWQKNDPNDYF